MDEQEPISKELFEVICCPDCKADLEYTQRKEGLKCTKCGQVFPIKEGIPILLSKDLQ